MYHVFGKWNSMFLTSQCENENFEKDTVKMEKLKKILAKVKKHFLKFLVHTVFYCCVISVFVCLVFYAVLVIFQPYNNALSVWLYIVIIISETGMSWIESFTNSHTLICRIVLVVKQKFDIVCISLNRIRP